MNRQVTTSVVVLAHNEEDIVEEVVRAYLQQRVDVVDVVDVTVVSCGSTDRTDEIVTGLKVHDPRLRLVTRPRRDGKLVAVGAAEAVGGGEILVLAAADVLPDENAVERLVSPFVTDSSCGMTGPRVVPAAVAHGPAAVLHAVLWQMHDEMATRSPKLGEVIALRRCSLSRPLPRHVHCDEVVLESRVVGSGGRLRYVRAAVVRNMPPTTVVELFRQRRRIACQHVAARRILGYRPASSRSRLVAITIASTVGRAPGLLPALLALVLLETVARFAGRLDFACGRRYRTWTPALQSRARRVGA